MGQFPGSKFEKQKEPTLKKFLIFLQNKLFLNFWKGALKPQTQKTKKTHTKKISYIFLKKVLPTFRDRTLKV